ncbi:hypothetical protein [Streptomyces kaempferi]|uniref:Uncharacterized protein n=1 Tax=Streptomyces kaempferi TaxID=333725 RepID=A0ABW3XAD5_9ACTN
MQVDDVRAPRVRPSREPETAGLERLQPLLPASASRAGRVGRAAAVRVSAAVSPAADGSAVVAVTPA